MHRISYLQYHSQFTNQVSAGRIKIPVIYWAFCRDINLKTCFGYTRKHEVNWWHHELCHADFSKTVATVDHTVHVTRVMTLSSASIDQSLTVLGIIHLLRSQNSPKN